MQRLFPTNDPRTRSAIDALFGKAPVLVEVRFPQMGTSPDWHLCEDEAELEAILDGLGAGVELHLSSVYDLKSATTPLTIRK